MKHVFVALTVSLSVMVLTRSQPAIEPYSKNTHNGCGIECYANSYGDCTNFISPCDLDDANCRNGRDPPSLWTGPVDFSECENVKAPNQVALCKSSCPVTVENCPLTGPVCAINSVTKDCYVFPELWDQHEWCCQHPEWHRARNARCINANLTKPGDHGKC